VGLRIGLVGRFRPYPWGPLPEEPFIATGLEAAGAQVSQIDVHGMEDGPALEAIRRFAADLLIFTQSSVLRPKAFWEAIKGLRQYRRRILLTPDLILWAGREAQYAAVAPYVDLVLQPADVDLRPAGIPNAVYFCAAATPAPTVPAAIDWSNRYEAKCAFVGWPTGPRAEAVKILDRAFGPQFRLYAPSERTGVWGANLARACSTAKVVVGLSVRNDVPGYWSDRLYQVPAHGGFLLHHAVEGIEDALVPGQHCATFPNLGALVDEVEKWAANDVLREAIRKQGCAHVRAKHTWLQRGPELVDLARSSGLLPGGGAGRVVKDIVARPPPGEQTLFRVVVPVYNAVEWIGRCLASIRDQNYRNWKCVVIDDASTDGTFDRAMQVCRLDSRFTLVRNTERAGALANIITAIDRHRPAADDVIVTVDGDDWLADNRVFAHLERVYRNGRVQLTYGQFRQSLSGLPGWCREYPEEVKARRAYRQFEWIATHLRTFRSRLWRQIRREHLNDPRTGLPWEMAWDVAMMVPMLEMCAPGEVRFIPEILYVYNEGNPISDHRKDVAKQRDMHQRILALPSYALVATAS